MAPTLVEKARQALLARRRTLLARRTCALSEIDDDLRASIAETFAALERIDDGRYGTCLLCQLPIEATRLALRPEVTHCAHCLRLVAA